MARDPAQLTVRVVADSAATSRRRRTAAALAVLLALAGACSRQPEPRSGQFVGQWKSSRIATMPLHMHANGEWEIKADEGNAVQYGVWQIQGRRILWTVRMDGRITHDENAILSVGPQQFELREQDGSVTRFERID
jgi:hypothetical protein